jgi:hydroxymethylbilane synthase
MFTKEIEDALLAGEIDAAVHSLKDLPGHLPAGVEVMAVLERANTGDVLISKTARGFDELPTAARIGTSSVRRRKQLLWMRQDLFIEEIRGNVPTRLRKLRESGNLDAIVLAQAGLDRLGFSPNEGILNFEGAEFPSSILPMLPAIGQGAVALEARNDDAKAREILRAINHESTFLCIRAERELLRLLDGDCHLPVGVETKLEGARLRMKAVIFGEDGQPPLTGEMEGDTITPEKLAQQLFKQLHENQT